MQDRLFIWMNFVPSTLTNSNQCENRFSVKFIDALLRSSDAGIVKHKQNVPAQSNCACFCKWSFVPTKGFLDQCWLHYGNNYHNVIIIITFPLMRSLFCRQWRSCVVWMVLPIHGHLNLFITHNPMHVIMLIAVL